jgi:hypothetical protein
MDFGMGLVDRIVVMAFGIKLAERSPADPSGTARTTPHRALMALLPTRGTSPYEGLDFRRRCMRYCDFEADLRNR